MSEKILGYQIIRKNVKNINLHIKADGIVYLSVQQILTNTILKDLFYLKKLDRLSY